MARKEGPNTAENDCLFFKSEQIFALKKYSFCQGFIAIRISLEKEVAVKFAYALSEKKIDPTPLCSRKLSRVGSINTDQIVAMREACLFGNFEIFHTY